jgi:hypothetical protein
VYIQLSWRARATDFSREAIFHSSRFARAGGAGFENLLTRASKTMNASPARAKQTLMENGLKIDRSTRAGKATAMENGLTMHQICDADATKKQSLIMGD